MKASILAVLVAASVASAVTLPTCGATCAVDNLSTSSCSAADEKCLCEDTTYQAAFLACVESSCSTADQETTGEYGTELCAAEGVTVTASEASSTASVASSASSSVASSVASSASAVAASTTAASSSVASSSSSSVVSIASSSATLASNGTSGNTTSSATPIAYTGGASSFGANTFVGLVAIIGAGAFVI